MNRLARLLLAATALMCASCSWTLRDEERPPLIASLNAQTMEVGEDEALNVDRSRAVAGYREFLADNPPDALRPEAMRRLADLRAETLEDRLVGDEPALSFESPVVVEESRQIIASYEQILADFPDYEANDQVLYQLGKAYEDTQQPVQAAAALQRLAGNYPESPFLAEAHFRRGETLFVEKDFIGAEESFRAVLEIGNNTDFYEQALYKRGWALFKQGLYTEGLDSFMVLLDGHLTEEGLDDEGLESLTRAERELVEDALRASSLSFTYEDGAESIAPYFERSGSRHYEDLVYGRLGELYLKKERYNDAADTYLAFVESNPMHSRAPLAQVAAIDAYKEGEFPSLVLEAKQDFVQRYNLESEYWQENSPADNEEVVGHLKTSVTDLATHFHAVAQETKEPEAYQQAARWYRTYLGSFSDEPEAAGQNFLLAEVLFESGQYADAAAEYERTAYQYDNHEKASEAGYAALLSYVEQQKNTTGEPQAQARASAIDSTLLFANRFPQHPETPTVLTKAAEDLFAANDLARAGSAARQVIAEHPGAEPVLRRTAWTVLGNAQFDQNDYRRAESSYQEALILSSRDDEQYGALSDRLAASVYKQGQASQQSGDLEAAVGHYLRVGTAVPDSAIQATAEYDAAAVLIQMEAWPRAAQVLETFRARYPENELQNDVTRKLAVAYMQSGDELKAADEFDRMGESETDPVLRQEATLQAAELYVKSGQTGRAAGSLERFVEEFPRPVEPAMEARKQLADIYASAGDPGRAETWLVAMVDADAKAGGERTQRTKFLAANAVLTLAEPRRTAYERVALVAPLDKSLALKKEKMEAALEIYGKAAEYDIADVTTAATYQIGVIYQDFGKSLLESERPAELSGEELEQYDILLEEEAFPFEEQAIEVYEANAGRVVNGVYDEWVRQSFSRLAELVPGRYDKPERGESFVGAIQ